MVLSPVVSELLEYSHILGLGLEPAHVGVGLRYYRRVRRGRDYLARHGEIQHVEHAPTHLKPKTLIDCSCEAICGTLYYLELFDVEKKAQIRKVPLVQIQSIPRIDERLFLPPNGPGTWKAYTVASVEYFLGYDVNTGQPIAPKEGSGRVTLYPEESK